MAQPHERTLLGVAIGHAAHDTWYGVAPIFLATLSGGMALSNSEIGLVLLLYQAVSSVTQPFFGRLSERIGGRPLAVGAILWTTLCFSGALFAGSKTLLATCIGLAGLGSGAWHPQGSANATAAGGAKWGATSASVFFLGGSLGSAFIGAALGGYLLETWGARALLILSAITVCLALFVVRWLVPHQVASVAASEEKPAAHSVAGRGGRTFWFILALLLLGTALRSLTMHTLNTYVPKYQEDLGVSSAVYGLVISFFITATAVGGVAGSYLADRIGIRSVLVCSMILTGLLLVPFVRLTGTLSYVSLIAAGLLLGPSHTLLLVAGQRKFPQRMAVVSGIFLGFNFVSGAGGAWVFGLLADQFGLGRMFGVLPWTLAGAAFFALLSVPARKTDESRANGS